MTIARPAAADREQWARAAARRRRRDEKVAAAAHRRARGSATATAAALRAEAGAQRAETNRLSTNCLDGSGAFWRAVQRSDRAADLLDSEGGS